MGLETVRGSLEGAVAALFAAPPGATDGAAATCAACGGSLAPPAAVWRVLRDFPVCVRSVVTAWRRLASSHPTKKRKATAHGSDVRGVSMARLCAVLYECGLVAGGTDDTEVVAMLVDAMDDGAFGSRDVLRYVLQHRALARGVRLRVFQHALETSASAAHVWVGEVALGFQDELKHASIEHVAPARKSKKRGRSAMGAFDKTGLCGVCAKREATRPRREPHRRRGTLVDALDKWLQGNKADEATVEAVQGLINVLRAPEVVHLLQQARTATPRPERDASLRPGRAVPSLKVRWDDCDRIVDAFHADAPTAMWRLVWRRERSRMGEMATAFGTLDEVVALCALADRFTHSTPQKSDADSGHIDAPVGFHVVREIASQATNSTNAVTTVLRAIAAACDRRAAAATTAASKAFLRVTNDVYFIYTRFLLSDDDSHDRPRNTTAESLVARRRVKGTVKHSSTTGDLLECVELLHNIVAGPSGHFVYLAEGKRRDLFVLWFQLVAKTVEDTFECHASGGAQWSLFLDATAQCCEEVKATAYRCKRSFEVFIGDMLVGILISDGARINPPQGCYRGPIPIPLDANEQSTLQALMGFIMTASGEPRIVAATIYRLVVVITRRGQAQTQLSKHRRRGISFPLLLFPLLDTYFNGVEGTSGTALSDVVEIVQFHIQTQCDSQKLTRGLVAFLFEWDSYCERHNRSITPVGPNQGDQQQSDRHGFHCVREHGVWEDLVRFYSSDARNDILNESPAFLRYVSELLRSINPESCPSELEGSLFSVLSSIGSVLTQSETPKVQPTISHSDESIAHFIHAFTSSTAAGGDRDLIASLMREDKLEDLALSLRRWLGILNADPLALSKETAAQLVMLANRLVFLGEPKLGAVQHLLAPVDGALISALQLFSTSQPSSSSQVSVVRLSVMTRAYLSVNTPQNLVALTDAFMDATCSCASPAARDGLIKLMQGFAAFLVMDVVEDRLRVVLLQVVDRASVKTVRNALAILTAAPRIVNSHHIGFSLDIFSVATAEKWLSAILLVGLSSDSTAKSFGKTMEMFLVCVESLLHLGGHCQDDTSNKSEPATLFQHAHALDALLSTVLVSFHQFDQTSSIETRILAISRELQSYLSKSLRSDGGSYCVDTKQYLLRINPTAGRSNRKHRGESSATSMYISNTVSIGSRGLEDFRVSLISEELLKPITFDSMQVNVFGSASGTIVSRSYLTFSSWIAATFVAQQQAPDDFANPDSCAAWELTFSEMVHHFYLPVQFGGDAELLTAEWLLTWISQCLSLGQCVELLPFQRSMLLEHLAAGNAWAHLVRCTKMLAGEGVSLTQGSEIAHHIVKSLDLVVHSSVRAIHLNSIDEMASDVNEILEKLQHPDGADQQRLTTLAPLLETFVRVSLRVSASSPHQTSIVECVKRVGLVMNQVLAGSELCAHWWSDCLSSWKRQLSHLNCRNAPQIIEALQVQRA